MSVNNPIKVLNPEVARKIAAGEVIDRPNAIIRELIDNSIDSGAKNITVEIIEGGIESIRIVDDGCGMTKEDLQSCARPHATSKIATETDLLNLTTMGFRGEALSSIAAVARLSIISGSYKMQASITQDHIITSTTPINGTIVQSQGLFENFPARRQFLKRSGSEALMCKSTFIQKAISRPDIAFKFVQDGTLKNNLARVESLKERFLDASKYSEPKDLFFEVKSTQNNDFSITTIIGEPSVFRTNKKDIFIYVNNRRIQEYSLVQAVEYGCLGYFPNGTFPIACVFIQINPKLVDFNIHPAKKEARFFDISPIHHALSSSIKDFFLSYTNTTFNQNKEEPQTSFNNEFNFSSLITNKPKFSEKNYSSGSSYSSFSNSSKNNYFKDTISESSNDYRTRFFSSNLTQNIQAKDLALKALEINITTNSCVKYVGKCLGTFLLAEKDNSLYIIDQHAVHERILFDKILKNQGKSQELLIPYKIHTDSDVQDKNLEQISQRLCNIGFNINKLNQNEWEVTSVPERWNSTQDEFEQLIFEKQVEPENIIRSIAAMTACKAAIKDGYYVDDQVAENLVKMAFELEDPHCPHGRPVYTSISREQLFNMVKRT